MNNAYLLDNPYGAAVGSGNFINADGNNSFVIAKINNAPILKIVNGKSQVVGYHQKGARVPSLGIKEIAINAVRKFRSIGQGSFVSDNKMFNVIAMKNGKPVLAKDVHVWVKNANGVAFKTDLIAKKGTPVSEQVYDFSSVKKVKLIKFGNGNFGNANLYSFNSSSSFDNGSDLLIGFDMDEDVMYNAAAATPSPVVSPVVSPVATPAITPTPIITPIATPAVTPAATTSPVMTPVASPAPTPTFTPLPTPTTTAAAPNALNPILTPIITTPMIAYSEPITVAPSSVLPTSTPPKEEVTTKPASKGAVMGGGGGGMGGGGGASSGGGEGAKVAAVSAPVAKKILGMKPVYFYSIVGLAALAGGIWAYKKFAN